MLSRTMFTIEYARFGITERTLRYDGAERSLKMEQY